MEKRQGVKSSLAAKIIIAFFMTIIPMIMGSIYIYMKGSALATSRIRNNMNDAQEYCANTIEYNMTSIYTQQQEIALSSEFSYMIDLYSVVSDYRRYELVNQVESRLKNFATSNPWVADIRIYIPVLNRIYYGKRAYSLLNEDRDFDEIVRILDGRKIAFIPQNGNYTVITRQGGKNDIRFISVVEISSDTISDHFHYLSSQQQFGMLLASNEGLVFSKFGDNVEVASEAACIQHLLSLETGRIIETEWGNEKYFIRVDDVFYKNLKLISISSRKILFSDMDYYSMVFMWFLVITLGVIVWFVVFFYRMINRPIVTLSEAFTEVCSGNFNKRIGNKGKSEFAVLYHGFNYMVMKIEELIQHDYQQKILVQQAELRQLHAQVDPHFLQNSFMNICAMAQMEDCEGIEEIATKLSQYYQYITKANKNAVTLVEEYEFVSLYADIQNIRFGLKIHCSLDPLPMQFHNIMIPRFLLQTLVENSYKYGAGTRDNGRIRITFEQKEHAFEICVKDNGEKFTTKQLDELNALFTMNAFPDKGTGLYNAYQRVRLFYRNTSTLKLECTDTGGMLVRIVIET